MRIALIVTAITNSGPENVVHDLSQIFTENGHYCKVFYFDAVRSDRPNININCDKEIITFGKKINFNDFDVIHAHGLRPNLYVTIHKPFFSSKARFVTTFHNFLFKDFKMNYGLIKGYLGGILFLLSSIRFDKVITLNKSAQNYYKRLVPKSKLTYAYNSRIIDKEVDICIEHKNIINSLREKYDYICCSICGLSDRKGLDQIIKALKNLPNICYIIVGDGPASESLHKLTDTLNMNDRVVFLGLQQKGYKYLPYIDIFCIPSFTEGFPLAMIEATAYKKAVVASDIEVFKEIYEDDEIIKFKLNDINDCERAIKLASANLQFYGENAYKHYIKDYSPTCFYKRHIEIYEGKL